MKANVDQDTCISCGLCPAICPEVFQMNDSSKAEAILPDVPKDLQDAAQEAADSCPVDAITVD